jgi:hypothetical protein
MHVEFKPAAIVELYLPGTHLMQLSTLALALMLLYNPMSQAMQPSMPMLSTSEYFPTAQSIQASSEAAPSEVYLPIVHVSQSLGSELPMGEYLPCPQSMHEVIFVLPSATR